jgi:hypothetical protein
MRATEITLAEFQETFRTNADRWEVLFKSGWSDGFHCPAPGNGIY